MSSTIEYNHIAFRFSIAKMLDQLSSGVSTPHLDLVRQYTPRQMPSYATDLERYVVFIQAGSSNCTQFKRINGVEREVLARDWYIIRSGTEDAVIANVCNYCSSTIGGGTVFSKNRRNGITPEAYIRKYRKVIADAIPHERTLLFLGSRTVHFSASRRSLGECPWMANLLLEGERLRPYGNAHKILASPESEDTTLPWVFELSPWNDESLLVADLVSLTRLTVDVQSMRPRFEDALDAMIGKPAQATLLV